MRYQSATANQRKKLTKLLAEDRREQRESLRKEGLLKPITTMEQWLNECEQLEKGQ